MFNGETLDRLSEVLKEVLTNGKGLWKDIAKAVRDGMRERNAEAALDEFVGLFWVEGFACNGHHDDTDLEQ